MTTPKIRANASTDGIDQMLRSCREKHGHGTDEPNADDLQTFNDILAVVEAKRRPEIDCPRRVKLWVVACCVLALVVVIAVAL